MGDRVGLAPATGPPVSTETAPHCHRVLALGGIGVLDGDSGTQWRARAAEWQGRYERYLAAKLESLGRDSSTGRATLL
jgi:hypothetical protein